MKNLKTGDNLVPIDGSQNRLIVLNTATYRHENQVLVFDSAAQSTKKILLEDLKNWTIINSPSG